MAQLTELQRETIKRKHTQSDQGVSLEEFIATSQPTIGCDDAVAIQWCGMWLCIETDGYCHT